MRRLLVLLLIVALAWGLWVARKGGAFRTLEPHFAGSCTAVGNLPGPEDLTIHPRTGVLYVSSCDRRSLESGGPANGGLYALRPGAAPVNLTPDAPDDYCPHGLDLWLGDGGAERLFVVRHQGERDSVEIFEIAGTGLRLLREVEHPLLANPNDVAAVGPESFYATNDHRHSEGIGRLVEEWLQLPWASLAYHDGQNTHLVVDDLRLANGVQTSADGLTVYVAETLGLGFRVYQREPGLGALVLREEVAIGSSPDNLEVDAAGDVWIGSHPNMFKLLAYRSGRSERAPSQVIRAHRDERSWRLSEVYLDLGDEISGASVAAAAGERLVIGAIWNQHLLDCEL